MTETLKKMIQSWLRHETAGRDRQAERALHGVFTRLPRPVPSAQLVGRILAEAGFAPAPWALPRDLPSRRLRALVTAAGALVAVALLFAPSVLMGLWAVVRSVDPLPLGADLLAAFVARVADSMAAWEAIAGVASSIGGALSSPQVLAVLVGGALVSLTAFGVLQSLLLSHRSVRHAES